MDTNQYIDFLFRDNETEEEFFVEVQWTEYDTWTDLVAMATRIAEENFEDATLLDHMSPEQASYYGYDTY